MLLDVAGGWGPTWRDMLDIRAAPRCVTGLSVLAHGRTTGRVIWSENNVTSLRVHCGQ
jgi:hypothetical protein